MSLPACIVGFLSILFCTGLFCSLSLWHVLALSHNSNLALSKTPGCLSLNPFSFLPVTIGFILRVLEVQGHEVSGVSNQDSQDVAQHKIVILLKTWWGNFAFLFVYFMVSYSSWSLHLWERYLCRAACVASNDILLCYLSWKHFHLHTIPAHHIGSCLLICPMDTLLSIHRSSRLVPQMSLSSLPFSSGGSMIAWAPNTAPWNSNWLLRILTPWGY